MVSVKFHDIFIILWYFQSLIDISTGISVKLPSASSSRSCRKSTECGLGVCVDGKCLNGCVYVCGPNTECNYGFRGVQCTCLPGYTGNPRPYGTFAYGGNFGVGTGGVQAGGSADFQLAKGCEEIKCSSDDDCDITEACINEKCDDPCDPNECGLYTECDVMNHKASCSCAPGQIYDTESKECFQCMEDENCCDNKACSDHVCQDPCTSLDCGDEAVCFTQKHTPECQCPDGLEFDAEAKKCTGCETDEDCEMDEKCIDRQCQNVCEDGSTICGVNSICFAYKHNPYCICDNSSLIFDRDRTACSVQTQAFDEARTWYCMKRRAWYPDGNGCNEVDCLNLNICGPET